jgi:transposase
MPSLTEDQRPRAIRMLQAGLAQHIVAIHFGVHRNTMQSLLRRVRQSGNTRDPQRSGRPPVTSPRSVMTPNTTDSTKRSTLITQASA